MMEKLELVLPTKEYKTQIEEYVQEFINSSENKSIDKWLKKIEFNVLEERMEEGEVPSTIYLTIRKSDNKIVGNIQIKHYLNEKLFHYGGHIRNSIRPYLHGGEATVHKEVVQYAELAKAEGFQVNMFTNGIRQDVLEQLDGIVDEIRFSYEPGLDFMLKEQTAWKSRIKLYLMATIESYPTQEDLMKVVNQALGLGMGVKVRTLNPVNPYAYKYQFVPYLHKHLLEMPEEEIFCDGNKAAYRMENGVIVRLGNMQLNPGHLKYNVDPDGVLHSRFTHSDKSSIVPEHTIEAEKLLFEPLLERLRNM